MSKPLAIGIDVGGTKLACALVDRQGQVLRTTRLPTNAAEGADAVVGRIAEGIGILLRDAPGRVDGIGIGAPGQVDPVRGTVSHAVNLGWTEVALVAELRKRLPGTPGLPGKPPIYINKDVNATAVGELYFGAAHDGEDYCEDFVFLSLGTGLGGGAIVHGRIVGGSTNFAMEVGHVSLELGGRLSPCGLPACPARDLAGNGI